MQLMHDHLIQLQLPLAVPTSILIDSEGRVAAFYRGPVTVDQLLEDVEPLPRSAGHELLLDTIPFAGKWHGHLARSNPYRLAWNLLDRGYLEDGIRYIEQCERLFGSQSQVAQLRLKLADQQLQRGEIQDATQNYHAARQLNSEAAMRHLWRAVSLQPEDVQRLTILGGALAASQNLEEATSV